MANCVVCTPTARPPAPDARLLFSEAYTAFRRPDAEEGPPAMGLDGFEPPAKDSLVGPDTLERSATLGELMMSTSGKRPAAPPRGIPARRRQSSFGRRLRRSPAARTPWA